jgi:SIR2-like domain
VFRVRRPIKQFFDQGDCALLLSPPESMERLLRVIDRPEPRLVVLVGSGLSYAASNSPNSMWRGLLRDGIQHLERTGVRDPDRAKRECASVDDAFFEGNLDGILYWAEEITKALGGVHSEDFSNWLEGSVGQLRALPAHLDIVNAIRELSNAGVLLATTNYDSILSDATGLPPITWQEHDDFLAVVNRRKKGILHIHGHWRNPSSIILGWRSYKRITHADPIQKVLAAVWLTKPAKPPPMAGRKQEVLQLRE